jgi:acyl carrier protein
MSGASKDIKSIVREAFLKELKEIGFHEGIGDDESLIETGIMDSLGVLIVLGILHEKFNISVTEEELIPDIFSSINSVCSFIEKKLGGVLA